MKTMDYMDLQMFAETNLNTTLSATTGNDLSAARFEMQSVSARQYGCFSFHNSIIAFSTE